MNKELNLSYKILRSVIIDKSYVSIELNKNLIESTNINTALVTKIVYGVLEKDITLEYFIRQFAKKMPKDDILILLKIVAYCGKMVNSIPHFALVNEIVNMSKKIDIHQSGFVNAISKKLISSQLVLPSKNDYTLYLSVKYSYPQWVIKELLKSHDKQFVEDLISHELPTLTHGRINKSKIDIEEFKSKLNELDIHFEPSLYEYTIYVDYAKLLKTELKDLFIVQGLPSIITCNAIDATNGNFLDVCASPGGKSVYIADNPNVDVYSCDIYGHRVDLINKYANNVGVKLKTFIQDGTKTKNEWIDKFDYVLCDVPCSNLGVSRKKPDVFLNKSYEDTVSLAGIQYAILNNSAKYVKKGGVLQYSTCTILDKENKDVINKFLKNHKDFRLTPIDIKGINIANKDNMYTFYPNLTNTEGFFIGRMIRL